ncbi:MAG: sigma-70 family RNA polymerase sigma factor [Acidobacteria bacterium]|nr:sigma-70 family RNA polymerase sigma factor [Acidobacteriota bacterium]MBK8148335.1 sigma-70 family RNA polymerase sigma factor [Acidobacteriota bacterium]MBK8813382.1 sigma-70 family RNA polymerase sigma factor [Acidobacteriota bacterium]
MGTNLLDFTRLAEEYGKMSEIDIARLAADGDELAFAEIVRRFSPRVFSYSSRFFRRHSLVEEAAQEVFLKAFTQLGNFEGRGSLEGWLTRITVTTCINILRSSKPQSELTLSDLNEDESNWLEERLINAASLEHQTQEDKLIAADLVGRVLDTLQPEESLLVQMLDGEGASVKEVSAATGWSEAKIKTKAFRVRRRMRESITKLLNAKDGKLRRIEL